MEAGAFTFIPVRNMGRGVHVTPVGSQIKKGDPGP